MTTETTDQPKTFSFKSRYQTHVVPANLVDQLLDGRVFRLVGTQEELVDSELYDHPLFCYHAKTRVFVRFRDLPSAFRTTTYQLGWEGVSVPEGEKQRLMAWLAEHQVLLLWVSENSLDSEARRQFERACKRLAKRIGKPIDEIKVQILEHTLSAATAEEPEAARILAETTDLDKERLGAVKIIGERINWRSLILLREILRQQTLLEATRHDLERLHKRHDELRHTRDGRDLHFQEVLELRDQLLGAKDRPYRGLGNQDRYDLWLYHQQAAIDGSYSQAVAHLERPLVAHRLFAYSRRLQAVLLRLGAAEMRRGEPRQELLAKARLELMNINRELDAMRPLMTAEQEQLRNNPYWRVLGAVKEALMIWRSPRANMSEIKELLRRADARFG